MNGSIVLPPLAPQGRALPPVEQRWQLRVLQEALHPAVAMPLAVSDRELFYLKTRFRTRKRNALQRRQAVSE
jgi:hypothetical protein